MYTDEKYNETVEADTDPNADSENRWEFMAEGVGSIIGVSEYACMCALQVSDLTKIQSGDEGVCMCTEGTFDCYSMTTVKAVDEQNIVETDNNGWENDYENNECKASDTWKWHGHT